MTVRSEISDPIEVVQGFCGEDCTGLVPTE